MKRCSKCGCQDESNFCKNKRKKDGLGTYCRDCNKQTSRDYYSRNKEKHRVECEKLKAKYHNVAKQKIQELKVQVGCQVEGCVEREPCCLDFHHFGAKDSMISTLVANACSWDRILGEIAKCSLVCSNCHRKIHAKLILSPSNTLRDIVGDTGKAMPSVVQSVCEVCNKLFTSGRRRYCSDECYHFANRKAVRPTREALEQEIASNSWVALGRRYGVSDNAVRKWARQYQLL